MAEWWVAKDGSDANPGTSAEPFLTIGEALSSYSAGDTINVRPGVYSESVNVQKNNATLKSTTYLGAILDGGWSNTSQFPHTSATYSTRFSPALHASGSNVTIDGFYVRNSKGRGIQATGDGWNIKNCKVENCFNTGCQSFYADNGVFDNIEVTYASLQRKWKNQTPVPGVTVGNHPNAFALVGSANSTIRYCHSHMNGGEGIDLFRCGGGCTIEYSSSGNNSAMNLYVNWAGEGATVRHNIAYQTIPLSQMIGGSTDSGGIELRDEHQSAGGGHTRSSDVEVYGNLVVGCSSLLWITQYAGMENAKVYNNTFIAGPYTSYGCRVEGRHSTATWTGAEMKNNIFVMGSSTIQAGSSSQIDMDYNLWSKQPPSAMRGSNDLTGSAGLVSTSGAISAEPDPYQYIKADGSPGIDAGTTTPMATDQFGTTVTNPDMGFDEYTGTEPPGSGGDPGGPGSTDVVTTTGTPTGNYSTSSSGDTVSHTTDSDTDVLVVAVMGMKSQTGTVPWTVSGVTFNGVSMTLAQRDQAYTTNRNYTTELWYLVSPSVGAYDVVTTLSATVNDVYVYALNLRNVDTGTPLGDTAANSNPSGGNYTASATITADGMWLMAALERGDSGSGWTPGTGTTELLDYASGTGSSDIAVTVAYNVATSTGSLTTSSTSPDGDGQGSGVWAEFLPGATGVTLTGLVSSSGVATTVAGTAVNGSLTFQDYVSTSGVATTVATAINAGGISLGGLTSHSGVATTVAGTLVFGSISISGLASASGVATTVRGGVIVPVPVPLTLRAWDLTLSIYEE